MQNLYSQSTTSENYSPDEIEYIKKHGKDRRGRLADVYTVKFDTVPDTPIKTVKSLVSSIRSAYLKLKKKKNMSDEKIRKMMCKKDKSVEYFATTSHPQLFKTITDETSDDKVMQAVGFLIAQKESVKRGRQTNYQATKNCQEYCLEKFKQ